MPWGGSKSQKNTHKDLEISERWKKKKTKRVLCVINWLISMPPSPAKLSRRVARGSHSQAWEFRLRASPRDPQLPVFQIQIGLKFKNRIES